MNKDNYTKKEIKAIKKDLQLNGVNISNFSNFEMENYIIFEILRLSNYQDFKNRFFEYIF